MAAEFTRSGPEAIFLVVVALPRYLGRHECVAATVVIAASAAPPGNLRAGEGRGLDRGVADRRVGGGDGRARLGAAPRAGRPAPAAGLLRGQVPAVELLEGGGVLIGGVFFLVPGFVSDVLGLLWLVPPLRRTIIRWALRRALIVPAPAGRAGANSGPRIIEGDFRRDDDPRFPR